MPSYRCYFLDGKNHIAAVEEIEAEAVTDAIDKALAMLRQRPHHRGIEVWDRAIKLYPPPSPA